MYRKSILGAALLCSMSSIAWAAADAGGGGGVSQARSLEEALDMLDTKADHDWTESGLPRIERLEEITGGDVTRVEVDNITKGAKRDGWGEHQQDGGDTAQNDAGPAGAAVDVGQGEVSTDTQPSARLSKDEKIADDVARAEQRRSVSSAPPVQPPVPGAVAEYRVADMGETVLITWPEGQTFDGEQKAVGTVVGGGGNSLNVKVFAPNGGADMTLTGVRHESKRNEMAIDSPDRNLPWWSALPARSAT